MQVGARGVLYERPTTLPNVETQYFQHSHQVLVLVPRSLNGAPTSPAPTSCTVHVILYRAAALRSTLKFKIAQGAKFKIAPGLGGGIYLEKYLIMNFSYTGLYIYFIS